MKKMIFITLIFLSLLSSSYAQHSVGVKGSLAATYLYSKHNLNGSVSTIYPILPNIETNYIYQKDDKTSFLVGAGIGHLLYYSQYTNEFYPEEQYLDDYLYLKIPVQYRKNLKNWLYVGTGVNARITIISTSLGNTSALPQVRPAYESHDFQLEAVGTVGVKFDFWKFSYHLGMLAEVPIIHREYFNLGIDTGLFFNF